MNSTSPPTSAGGMARSETATARPRSGSFMSGGTSRPGTATSVRLPDEEAVPKTAVKVGEFAGTHVLNIPI